jgi:hypothetical protein
MYDYPTYQDLTTLAALPIAWVFAIIPMGPAACIFGALGASWAGHVPRRIESLGLKLLPVNFNKVLH